MPRRLVLVALMLSLLLQASVLGQPFGGTGGKAQSSLHDLLHWARMAHHHHARQTLSDDEVQAFDAAFKDLDLPASAYAVLDDYSQDQSSDSTQHVLMDGCLVGPAMIPSWPGAMGARPAGGDAPHRVAERMVPAPFIEGPHRPPRHTA